MIKTQSNKFVYLALFLFLSYFMSWWGGYITDYFKEPWYSTIVKPSYTPPDWIFAPVWVSLYLLMGYATWLMWSTRKNTQKVLNIYFIHLIFNASWSITFFAFHQILVSLIIIYLLFLWMLQIAKNVKVRLLKL